MRAVVQRVKWAKVEVEGRTIGEIGPGLLTFLGVGNTDGPTELDRLITKILALRIFEDGEEKMNRSIIDVAGSHLIVSQFTLYANTQKGNRPSFIDAAPPEQAKLIYERALELSKERGVRTQG